MTREEVAEFQRRGKRGETLLGFINMLDDHINGIDTANGYLMFYYMNKDKDQCRCGGGILDIPDEVFSKVMGRHVLAGLNELRDKYQKEFDEL